MDVFSLPAMLRLKDDQAIRIARLAIKLLLPMYIGFLGFLGFLAFVPGFGAIGLQRLFGFFGFFGLSWAIRLCGNS